MCTYLYGSRAGREWCLKFERVRRLSRNIPTEEWRCSPIYTLERRDPARSREERALFEVNLLLRDERRASNRSRNS